jgi:tetratricopeptide (TPR) repeat protein
MRWPAVAAAALAFAALFFSDGSSQSRLFWIGSAAVIVAAVGWALRPPALSPVAAVFLGALGAFVLWQAATIAWSIQPSRSWDYTNRGLVYFGFAAVGTLLGGVAPRRLGFAASALLGALFAWALAAKIIPGLYSDYGRLARLRYPVGYWNELGLLAAASVPIGLWLVRRIRVAGVLLLYAALVVVVLTYSRVGIVLTVAAALAWLALDRDRFELVAPLGVAWIAGAAVAGIALLLPGVSDDGQLHGVRVQDGLIFGAALVLGALAVVFASHVVLSPRLVRAVAVALVAIVVAALAASVVRSGGPVDFVQDRWHEFANPVGAQVPNKFQRVATVSSSNRWRWWQEAWNAFVDHPLKGTGAGTFGLTDRLERDTSLAVVEPHSAPLQDLSETGIVGFLLIATALAAAAVAIARREHTRATIALALAAAVCVLHSLVDIDWDYVAVQGPLLLVVGALVASPARAPVRRPWFVAAAAGLCALAALYSLASPWLAQRRVDAAYDAFGRVDIADARNEANAAHALNPLAVQPLSLMALAESLLGRNGRALELYRQARDLEPKNPETWFQLGAFELDELHQPRHAYRDLNQSYTLDSYGPAGLKGGKLDQARCQVDPATCQ